MDGKTLYSIGELARRTGLTVTAIRFYSDRGIVPAAERSPAGYRLYGADAVARLDLVRTLRELGLDLPTVGRVLAGELTLPEAAAAQAEALTARIGTLRLRRAVLTAVARRGSTPEEMDLMHKLAKLSEDERRALIADFLDAVFGDLATAPAIAGLVRTLTPELPAHPEPEQIESWVELAELTENPDFRAALRRMAEQLAADAGGSGFVRRDPVATVRDQVRPALAAGVDPASPGADGVVAEITARYAHDGGPRRLLARLETANDPRRERYLELLAVINGWPAPERVTPALDWSIRALRLAVGPTGRS
ncbi:MerR family transcriptional regulator [Streptomyces sp. AcH 505]|uniref:MerR family transcriptional regulator n=1 Tax=Streptomyces sp. AcH 505 TaxID=352211 RepID=UPI000591864A|nr:MerR family transcriptional regulator [Streptomyces sp. AcH 505]